jgi:predicted TPR repeat methyltransferase
MGADHLALIARAQQLLASGHPQQLLDELASLPLASHGAELAYLHAVAAAHRGDRARSEAALARCLESAPGHPGALFQRAAFALADGRVEIARQGFEAAAAAAPSWAEAHYNLAVVQAELGDFDAAESSYRRALQAQPRLVQASNNLANLLCARGAHAEAIALMRTALSVEPGFAIGWCTLGRSLLRKREPAAAIEALKHSLALDSAQAAAWENLGEALQLGGAAQAATEAYARALALNPSSAPLAFKLDTLRGAQPPRPPDDFVRDLFDDMAGGFDHWLVEALDYRLPEQLSRYLPDARGLDVLDLGCGTGLAAPTLRTLARRLEGADLSAKMLAKAAARGCYDGLHEASLQDVLARQPAAWDMLLATDVFIYVGALDEVFALAARALRRCGWLLFSIETFEATSGPGFRLQPSGRYAHRADAVRALAHAHGFEVELDQPIDLRREREQMLRGRVLRLRLR